MSSNRPGRKRRKRTYGQGGYRPVKGHNDLWEIYWRPAKGARPIYKRVRGSEGQAKVELDRKLGERHRREEEMQRGITFEVAAENWHRARRVLIGEGTAKSYRQFLDCHLLPAFGDSLLDDLRAQEIRDFQTAKLEGDPSIPTVLNGEPATSPPLAPWTVKTMMRILKAILAQARGDRLMESDPFEGVEIVSGGRPDIEPLTAEEVQVLLGKLASEDRMAAELMAHLGLRIGETFALLIEDYTADHRVLAITKTLKRKMKGKPITSGPPKTIAGKRRLVVGKEMHERLSQQIRRAKDE